MIKVYTRVAIHVANVIQPFSLQKLNMIKKHQNSCFISVEGAEGVGKSFFIESLSAHLSKIGIKHIKTREPGGTVIGESIRDIFSRPPGDESLSIEAEFLLIAAARAQHVQKKIAPSLKNNIWVLCDRYVDSSRVYQGSLGGLSQSFIETTSEQCTKNLHPDVTFLLECDVDLALMRLSKRQVKESDIKRYDDATRSFHEQLKRAFHELALRHSYRIVRLNSAESIQSLLRIAQDQLEKRCLL